MQNPPREVLIIFFVSIIFWVFVVGFIWIWGGRWERLRGFRNRMQEQWKPALGITVFYLVSVLLRGRGLNPYGLVIFCQALLGLTIARGIPDFEALPVAMSVLGRERVVNNIFLFVVFGSLAGLLGMVVGSLGMGIAQNIFHETNLTTEVMQEFPANKFQLFFMLLAGAGIAEEVTYRLFLLSFILALTKRPWLAIFVSAFFHSAYHLTPLNQLYLSFLQFPISQFLSGALVGTVWGYVFVKRGLETAALAHTMSDWIPMLLFM